LVKRKHHGSAQAFQESCGEVRRRWWFEIEEKKRCRRNFVSRLDYVSTASWQCTSASARATLFTATLQGYTQGNLISKVVLYTGSSQLEQGNIRIFSSSAKQVNLPAASRPI
jgi:hypothetical protein